MTDSRDIIVDILKWMVWHQPQIYYGETSDRLDAIGHPGTIPFRSDCSGTSLIAYNWAGCEDPTKANPPYSAADTETWAAGGKEAAPENSIRGDAVIYGLGGPLSVQHMALLVEDYDPNNQTIAVHGPMTVSHGWSGQPSYVRAFDGDPTGGAYGVPRFFRYNTTAISPVWEPPGYKVTIRPGSYASQVPGQFLPTGTPPDMALGSPNTPTPWVVYARLCGRAAGVWPKNSPVGPGGYGILTRNMIIRFERQRLLAPDGLLTPRVWRAFGLEVA
jgi:hypothetical protein